MIRINQQFLVDFCLQVLSVWTCYKRAATLSWRTPPRRPAKGQTGQRRIVLNKYQAALFCTALSEGV